jgi:uncharacterized protein (DUF3084 family)
MQEEGMNAVTEVMDELRKALAELEDCRARNADLRTMLEQVTRERDEARADDANAYRRGAEAMREACAVLVSNEKRLWLRSELIADLRALPIPEEP